MLTAIHNKNLIFSNEDVQDAEWIIQTSNQLDHGILAQLWAWRVINWYLNLHKEVTFFFNMNVKKHIKITVEEVYEYVMSLVTQNKLII